METVILRYSENFAEREIDKLLEEEQQSPDFPHLYVEEQLKKDLLAIDPTGGSRILHLTHSVVSTGNDIVHYYTVLCAPEQVIDPADSGLFGESLN